MTRFDSRDCERYNERRRDCLLGREHLFGFWQKMVAHKNYMVLARVPFLLEGPRLIFFCSAETRENLVWTDEEHRRIPGQPLNALVGVAVGVGCETAAAAVAARGPLLGDDPEGYIEDGHGDSEPRNHLFQRKHSR